MQDGQTAIKAPGLEPDVRKKAAAELAKLAHGKDPARDIRQDRKQVWAKETTDKLSRKTLQQAFDDYIADQQPSAGTQTNHERAIRLAGPTPAGHQTVGCSVTSRETGEEIAQPRQSGG